MSAWWKTLSCALGIQKRMKEEKDRVERRMDSEEEEEEVEKRMDERENHLILMFF